MSTSRWFGLGLMTVVACGAASDAAEGEGAAPSSQAPAPDTPAGAQPGGPAAPPGSAEPSAHRCDPARAGAIGERELSLTIEGQKRTAYVHVPKGYDPAKGTALVLAFHGYGSNVTQMRGQTGFDAASDARGFIVAYAEGTGLASKGFNGGDCCGRPAWSDETDDLGLARAIVKALSADYCVDPKRVYSAGFSNGGFMSYRFVCEAADVFAAVASVSGVLGTPPETCKPARAVPILHVHGTADTTVPYQGGPAAGGLGALAGINFRSVTDSVTHFRKSFACAENATPIFAKGDTKCEAWSGCSAGARVELCTVEGGGHQWPGGQALPVGGKTSTDLATSERLLDFFAAHPMP
ncbi:MAG: prolyl oligopeptidase family serine peptidase [Labilithrix sp.]|nr:prolyl oligopeptidase family serine peptidase [Labilithrix sp.]